MGTPATPRLYWVPETFHARFPDTTRLVVGQKASQNKLSDILALHSLTIFFIILVCPGEGSFALFKNLSWRLFLFLSYTNLLTGGNGQA